MAVNVEIKQNQNEVIELTIPEIAALKDLRYGISDNNYLLEEAEVGQYTILFDEKKIGRGFEVSFEDNGSIYLRLPLPTTGYEIELFYDLVKCICEKVNVDSFTRDEGIVPLVHAFDYIEPDKQASLEAIKNIDNSIRSKENSNMILFGVFNPISLGEKEMDEINCSLEGFENFMDRLQQKDVFYASPRYYQRRNGTIFGVYFVGEEIVSVVPLNPHSPFCDFEKVDSYYVRIPDCNDIPYDDFISHVDKLEDYDNDHIIISLNEDKIYELSSHYTVNMTTQEKIKGSYFGKTLDDGRNHLNKIRNLKLPIEEWTAFNHLAVFLRWMGEHDMLSERLLNDVPDINELINDKNTDLRKLIVQNSAFDCQIKASHFNDIGRDFAKRFYIFGEDGYPSCVDKYAESYFGTEKYNCEEFKNEAYLFVPYNEEYYQGLSQYIDEAFKEYTKNYMTSNA